MEHAQKAMELFRQGCNCSQAVLVAFCDETGLDEKTSMKLASSFGGGMGRMREVCGAVSGMLMVAGLKYGYTNLGDQTAKTEHYHLVQTLAGKFREENGSIICRELLGLGEKKDGLVPEKRTESYYKKRPCAELVAQAARIMDTYIQERNKEEKR